MAFLTYEHPRYGTHYYPVLTYFHHEDDELYVPGGNPERISERMDLQSLLNFVAEYTGINRTKTGELAEYHGTIKELDALISEAEAINDSLVELITAAGQALRDEHPTVDSYISYAKKIAERGEAFIDHEIARLEKLYGSDSRVSAEKKTDLNTRANVVKAFKRNFNPPYGNF